MTATAVLRKPRPVTNRSLVTSAEVLLTLATVASVAALWRLLDGWSFLLPVAVHATLAHAVAAGCRRRGLPLLASGAVQLLAALFVLVWVHLWSTTVIGVPTPDTFRTGIDELTTAWRGFADVRAPAPVLTGFVLSAGAAAWVAAWLADVAAFRLWTPFEALVPSGTIFVFGSLFAADRNRVAAAALWLGIALAFVLVHRTARQQGSPSWLGNDPRPGTRWLLRAGGVVVVAATAAGALLGPSVPTAGAEPRIDLGDLDGSGSRTTVSPLVEIQRRLVEQADIEVFTVDIDQPVSPYWRLTALDIFDGTVWSSRGSFGDAEGDLPGLAPTPAGSTEVSQRFSLTGLAAIWLPAAFEPRRIEPDPDSQVRWEAESATLIVSTDYESSDGFTYDVTSSLPAFDPAALAAVPSGGDVPAGSLDLPPDFPADIRDLAASIVAGLDGPYAQARALQDYFRSGSFTYSLDAPPFHSNRAMEEFLFTDRRGYCEQFAGTFAAMARSIGLPARVAVGFTPGELDPEVPNRFHVRGEHAHAWPEVWIPTAGWVPFEPTPGRGSAASEAWTGVPAQQDTPGTPTEPGPAVPSTTTPVPDTVPGQAPGGPAGEAPGAGDDSTTTSLLDLGAVPPEQTWPPGWLVWSVLGLAGAVVAMALAGGAVALYRWARRARRRSRASTPEEQVTVAWADALDDLTLVGIVPRRDETPAEVAQRAVRATGQPHAWALSDLVSRARYAPGGAGEEDPVRARELADLVRDEVHARTSRRDRVLAAVDPRSPATRLRMAAPRPQGPRIHIEPAS